MSPYAKRTLRSVCLLATIFVLAAIIYGYTPPNTFSPFCTYSLAYDLNVTIEAGGKQYSSEVVSQLSKSRKWISTINSGCQQTYGTALSFRLDDNTLILLNPYICGDALRALAGKEYDSDNYFPAMHQHRKIDVNASCVGVRRNRSRSGFENDLGYDGFAITDADNPALWRGLNFDGNEVAENLRIVSAVAEAEDTPPRDSLDNVAPAVLKTNFKYRTWSSSPEMLLSFARRYEPAKKFTYNAEEESPQSPSYGGHIGDPMPPAPSGYSVLLLSEDNESDVQLGFSALQSRFPAILGSLTPRIKPARYGKYTGKTGVYYRAAVGPFVTSDEASEFCAGLRSAGGACAVLRDSDLWP
jgi:hypothetical protein